MKSESEIREELEVIQYEIDYVQDKIKESTKDRPTQYELSLQQKAMRQKTVLEWVLEDA